MIRPKPLVLTILDGWGYAPPSKSNAISLARKPTFDRLVREYPNTLIHTSGRYVGLPDGQMGNSEVGHLNIGAGRIVYMDITRIDLMIESGEFFRNSTLLDAMHKARQNARQLHLLGLLSDGGVHSHQKHLYALLRMARENGVERVFVHAFMDGRDTLPTSGASFLEQLQKKTREYGIGKIATLSGRYYAMDRDRRWERVKKAFDAMVHGNGEASSYSDPVKGTKQSYNQRVTDEFILPLVICDAEGQPLTRIRDEDVCINFNFRADRARQITRALARESGLSPRAGRELADSERLDEVIPRASVPRELTYVCMTRYDKQFTLPFVVPPELPQNILANIFSELKLRNLRVAETEKYAHVTYFFNGGVEKPFPGEDRILVPSPKVATYDLQPEMSAFGVADAVVKAIDDGSFDVIIVNFANADMVGHSGKIAPTVKAIEAVDSCLGRIYHAITQRGGALLVTADHGNAEQMIDPETGGPHTAHTTNAVPLIVVSDRTNNSRLRTDGALQDIAPTVLALLGIPKPAEMTGKSLLDSS
jgi:2,3-bisphosphoglycerate-independent phosphoglycerate mutase